MVLTALPLEKMIDFTAVRISGVRACADRSRFPIRAERLPASKELRSPLPQGWVSEPRALQRRRAQRQYGEAEFVVINVDEDLDLVAIDGCRHLLI